MSTASEGPNAPPLERVGTYQLVSELEQGTLGPLWGARVTKSSEQGRLVVLRRLSTVTSAPRQVERIVEAATVAKNLRHSKLAAVLDVIVAKQEIALIGEYVEGPTLSLVQRLAYTKRSPLPPAVALRIAVDLLHGLRAARDGWQKLAPQALQGASHGGLLPENVFIATFGEVLLGEIGVAAVASALEPFRTLAGVAAYRAPEQLRASPSLATSERADVFSVGVVLWELLANRPLFGDSERLGANRAASSADADAQTLRDLQSKLIPALSSGDRTGPPVPRAAIEVVERALRRDPTTRYATIDQMLGALLALGREVVANGDQVTAAIERLAGSEFAAQRAALGPTSGHFPSSRPSATPDSGRPTHRPSPPLANAAGTPGVFDQQPAPVEQFSQHEAPTFPTAQLAATVRSGPPPPPRRKPTSTAPPPAFGTLLPPGPAPLSGTPLPPVPAPPSGTPLPPVPAPPSGTPLPPVPALAFGTPLPPLPDVSEPERSGFVAPTPRARHVSTAPDVSLDLAAQKHPVSARQSRARMIALVVGGVIGLIGLLAIVRAMLGRSKPEDAAPVAVPAAAEPLPRVEQAQTAPTGPPPSTVVAPAEDRPEPVGQPKTVASEAPSRAEGARTAPPTNDQNRAEPRPEPQKKAFRPKGI